MAAIQQTKLLESLQQDTIQGIIDLKSIIESNQFTPQLPSPWEEHFSDTHGIPYYYNPITKESSWEFPKIEPAPKLTTPTKKVVKEDHSVNLREKDDLSVATSMSQSSRTTGSSQRVEDNLMRKGQSYLHRREELKKEYEERLLSEHTGKPQLSKYTEKIFANKSSTGFHSLPIGERTKILLERKKTKEEALKRELEQKMDQEMRSTPQITKKSHHLASTGNEMNRVEAMLQWDESRRERHEIRVAEIEASRLSEYTMKPTVAKKTEKILRESGRLEQHDGMTVEERLLEYEEKKKMKRLQAVQKQNLESRQQALKSTTYRSEEVVDRLYHRALTQKQMKEEILLKKDLIERSLPVHQPKINKTSAKLVQNKRPQNVPIEEYLSYQGQIYQLKAKERQLINELEAQKLSSERKINPNSVKILRQSGQHTEERTAARLTRPIGTVKQKTLESIEQPTFHPTIAKKSKQMTEPSFSSSSSSSTKISSLDRFDDSYSSYQKFSEEYNPEEESELYECPNNDHSYTLDPTFHQGKSNVTSSSVRGPTSVYLRSQRWLEEKEQRMKKEKLIREEQELNECSFRPKIKDRNDDNSEIHEGSHRDGEKSMAERQAEWQRRRDEKIEKERREKEMKDLAECSFTPSLGKTQDPIPLKGVNNRRKEPLSTHQETSNTAPLPPSRSVPRIGPRNEQSSHSHSNSASLYSSHPQEYISSFSEEQHLEYGDDSNRNYFSLHRGEGSAYDDEGGPDDVYPPPTDGHHEAEEYFLEGSSEFIAHSSYEDLDPYNPEFNYLANENENENEDEENEEYEGRYLSYSEFAHVEEDEPDQYPLPNEEYDEYDYDQNQNQDHEDQQWDANDHYHGDYYDPYEIDQGVYSPPQTRGNGAMDMYGPPPPPSSPPPSASHSKKTKNHQNQPIELL